MTPITTLLKKILILNCYLLTDSLNYEIKSENVYEETIQKIQSFLILSMKKLLAK